MDKNNNQNTNQSEVENIPDTPSREFGGTKAQGVMDGADFDRFQTRLESVGGNREIYDICFGEIGDYPAMG